jgi:hypothetical protein
LAIGLQPRALESRADVIAGEAILIGIGEPPAHRVAGEEEQIGAKIALRDRLVAGRFLLRGERTPSGQRNNCGERSMRTETSRARIIRVDRCLAAVLWMARGVSEDQSHRRADSASG